MSTVDFHSRYQGLNARQLEKLRPKERELSPDEQHLRERAGKQLRFVAKIIGLAKKDTESILRGLHQDLVQINRDIATYSLFKDPRQILSQIKTQLTSARQPKQFRQMLAALKSSFSQLLASLNLIDLIIALSTKSRNPLCLQRDIVEKQIAFYEEQLAKINDYINSDDPQKSLSLQLAHELYQAENWEDAYILAEQTLKSFQKFIDKVNAI